LFIEANISLSMKKFQIFPEKKISSKKITTLKKKTDFLVLKIKIKIFYDKSTYF
jgi:hypothetical protein